MEKAEKIQFTGRLFVRVRETSGLSDEQSWNLIAAGLETLMTARDGMLDPGISGIRGGMQIQRALDRFSADEIEAVVNAELENGRFLAQETLALDPGPADGRSSVLEPTPNAPTPSVGDVPSVGSAVTEIERPEHPIVAGHETGETMIDGYLATEIDYFRHADEQGEIRYDLRFYNVSIEMEALADLTVEQLVVATGERNAQRIMTGKEVGHLKGADLANEYGLSPREAVRRVEAKEARKARDMQAMDAEPMTRPANLTTAPSEQTEEQAGFSEFNYLAIGSNDNLTSYSGYAVSAADGARIQFDFEAPAGCSREDLDRAAVSALEIETTMQRGNTEGALVAGEFEGADANSSPELPPSTETQPGNTEASQPAQELSEGSDRSTDAGLNGQPDNAKTRLLTALSAQAQRLAEAQKEVPEEAAEARLALTKALKQIGALRNVVERNDAMERIQAVFDELSAAGVPLEEIGDAVAGLATEQAERATLAPEVAVVEPDAIRPVQAAAGKAKGPAKAAQAKAVDKDKDVDAIQNAEAPKGLSDAPLPPAGPGSLMSGTFVRDEQGNYRRKGEEKVALADETTRIRFVDKQMDTFQAAVELAASKGWMAIEVTGSEKFRAEAWMHARLAGLEVVGYEASTQDQERLEAERVKLSGRPAPQTIEHSKAAAEAVARLQGKVP